MSTPTDQPAAKPTANCDRPPTLLRLAVEEGSCFSNSPGDTVWIDRGDGDVDFPDADVDWGDCRFERNLTVSNRKRDFAGLFANPFQRFPDLGVKKQKRGIR